MEKEQSEKRKANEDREKQKLLELRQIYRETPSTTTNPSQILTKENKVSLAEGQKVENKEECKEDELEKDEDHQMGGADLEKIRQ